MKTIDSKRFSIAKYFINRGKELLKNNTQLSSAHALLLFHDAAEILLLAIADHIGYKVPESFMKHWEEAKKKAIELPYINELNNLNRLRVSIKHYGILPSIVDCKESERIVTNFFLEVLKDIFSLNFNSISLSDLVLDNDIRKHLAQAEKFINDSSFEKSLTESALAFTYVLKSAQGDYFHSSFLLKESHYDIAQIDPALCRISGSSEIDSNFVHVKKSLNTARKIIESVFNELNALLLGVDYLSYKKFRLLTPQCSIFSDGNARAHGFSSEYFNKYNFDMGNSLFCYNFVLDIAIKLQENSIDLINPNFPKRIKVIVEEANIYSHDKVSMNEIGKAKLGEIFESNSISVIVVGKVIYKEFIFNKAPAYMKNTDFEPCQ